MSSSAPVAADASASAAAPVGKVDAKAAAAKLEADIAAARELAKTVRGERKRRVFFMRWRCRRRRDGHRSNDRMSFRLFFCFFSVVDAGVDRNGSCSLESDQQQQR